jgi:endonuclease/exonuclease/phosphatase family metal-dependent hydrolase
MNGSKARAYPHLEAATPRPAPPKSSGTVVRVASFNVRTARATADSRNWLTRAIDVAKDIDDNAAGIVALQELGPGRADGKTGSLDGTMRQTESLVRALSSIGASRYQLVRETAYNAPGTDHATQGARLLYDSSRYSVVSKCPETTGKSNWNGSCSFDLPVLDSEGPGARRSAAYAEFKDKHTGKQFFVFSVHMDQRHGKTAASEAKYEELRRESAAKINSVVSSVNTDDEEVIVAGDFNSWQTKIVGNAPHDYLIDKGYYDTAAALTTNRLEFPTVNHFKSVLAPGGHGYGVRIDMILVLGTEGARSFTNVVDAVDSSRASDHNMIVSELVL